MNWLDIVLLAVIGLSIFEGLKKGLTRQLLELGGLIIAYLVASSYGSAFGEVLSGVLKPENYAANISNPFLNVDSILVILYNALGYFVLFIAVLIATRFLAIALGSVVKVPVIGTVDKFGGLGVGIIKGVLIALVLVWVLNLLPIPSIEEVVESSRTAQTFLNIAPGLFRHLRDAISAGLALG